MLRSVRKIKFEGKMFSLEFNYFTVVEHLKAILSTANMIHVVLTLNDAYFWIRARVKG